VVMGGVMAIGIALGGAMIFAKLRGLNKVNDAAPIAPDQQ